MSFISSSADAHLPDHGVHLGELGLVLALKVGDGLVGLLQLALRVALQQLEAVLGLFQPPVDVSVRSLHTKEN